MDEINQLAIQMIQGDDAAFHSLTALLTPRLLAVARGYVGQDADDAVQEVWMKLHRFRRIMEAPVHFTAYMVAATRHACIDMIRKRRYVQVPLDELQLHINGLLTDYRDPETLTLDRESADLLIKCIHLLPELYSLPIHLYYREELPLRTIADMLDLPQSTIKWRLYMGRQLLRKQILTGGFEHDT